MKIWVYPAGRTIDLTREQWGIINAIKIFMPPEFIVKLGTHRVPIKEIETDPKNFPPPPTEVPKNIALDF